MSCFEPVVNGQSIRFRMDECVAEGRKRQEEYCSASPFPHIVVDDLLPLCVLRRVVEEFPAREERTMDDAHSRFKMGYALEQITSDYIHNVLCALNSAQFLRFLEEMTGIDGLIPDPHYVGGGLHETSRGGHLSIHADFNVQQKLKVIRRLNLILYLNEEWRDEYGGHLELWHRDMSGLARRVAPRIGRAVVFNTDADSYHGHPEPLASPHDVYRRSIALYYYTAPTAGLDDIRQRSTQFKVRRGSDDRRNYRTMVREMCHDVCPPVLWRALRSAKRGRSAAAENGDRS